MTLGSSDKQIAMGLATIGGAFYSVKIKSNTAFKAGFGDSAINGFGGIAEFTNQIGLTIYASRGHCGIKQKTSPDIARGYMGASGKGCIKPLFTNIAPGANDIGVDFNINRLRHVPSSLLVVWCYRNLLWLAWQGTIVAPCQRS